MKDCHRNELLFRVIEEDVEGDWQSHATTSARRNLSMSIFPMTIGKGRVDFLRSSPEHVRLSLSQLREFGNSVNSVCEQQSTSLDGRFWKILNTGR